MVGSLDSKPVMMDQICSGRPPRNSCWQCCLLKADSCVRQRLKALAAGYRPGRESHNMSNKLIASIQQVYNAQQGQAKSRPTVCLAPKVNRR
ncbi:hypothetical protein THAOC_09899 [Thalassiosira oceanica]|uniref:Uncharacterized protein n=1 Tax=Thalassiosira oceanica TaxID=159749 RepID=K0SVA7_THAOC|nr:hypothetical protein THAOC_09899 [Thalassiosira oceanica]|eukprot:EJK68894.1 hypothetical protein THAOC_09899 [Thalassiosira oceanica]